MQQTAVKYGIIAGIGTVLYLLVFYFIDSALILKPLVYWSTLIIAVVGMAAAVSKVRSENGGHITRKDAMKTAFLVFVISMLFFNALVYILFNFVAPELSEMQKQIMEAAGRDVSHMDFNMTPGKVFFGYAFSLIGGFFISYLVASIMKR
ncbi:MAG: DUF4199 domain-containing protein [Saprospiraceae bacterium]|nr:MAG: DUF4199 domain-containing protein [Saprospiraceae bacterium]